MRIQDTVLAVDVGSGTQDILLYLPGKNLENCPKMVMPSRTQIVAEQIRQATAAGKDLFLSGTLMGGGACTAAVKQHLKQGLKVFAGPGPAKTFHDDLAVVMAMGVKISESKPPGAVEVVMGDLDFRSLKQALGAFGLKLPERFAIALQDHGEALGMSNREFRFQLWREFILSGGELSKLAYTSAPGHFTRMKAVQDLAPNSLVMDTGAAAAWGILCDPQAAARREEGLIALNIGNSHTLGLAIQGFRVMGLFEHHTGLLNPDLLRDQVKKLMKASITHEEVFAAGGHGAFLHPEYRGGFEFVALTGPRWEMAQGFDFHRVAPFGDMMLTGCFGLLAAAGLIG